MKFISVKQLATSFNLEYHQINDELIKDLRIEVDKHFVVNDVLKVFEQDFTFNELTFILDQLKDEKNRMFHDWVKEDISLSKYLCSNGEEIALNHQLILSKNHPLFKDYQFFLTTYLSPVLSHQIKIYIDNRDLTALGAHLKFSELLPNDKRIEIQQNVSLFLRKLLAQLKMSQHKAFKMQLQTIYSYSFVDVLNALDKKFYTDAISYVETARGVVLNNELAPLVLDSIKTSLLSLELNRADREKVLDFCKSDVFTVRKKPSQSNIKNIVRSPLFFVAVISVVINFVVFYPLDKQKQSDVPNSGSKNKDVNNPKPLDTLKINDQDSILL
ncbi:MAG TPA: hypothetical protein VKY37_09485 [Brumimicrobium sp.]|nr:hypothetical protein [Brumimicrobium sp.]